MLICSCGAAQERGNEDGYNCISQRSTEHLACLAIPSRLYVLTSRVAFASTSDNLDHVTSCYPVNTNDVETAIAEAVS